MPAPKGLSSFLRQSIYVVALFIFLAIVISIISSFTFKTYETTQKVAVAEKANQLMDVIVQRCFHGEVTQDQLDDYQKSPEKLMECANSHEFYYWLNVSTLSRKPPLPESYSGRSVHGYTVLVIDTSGSMGDKIGSRTRMDITKSGIEEFLKKCTSSYDRFGIVIFDANADPGTCNSHDYVSVHDGLSRADAIQFVSRLAEMNSNTPVFASLSEAIRIAKKNGGKRIILFTDGGDTCYPEYYKLNNDICYANVMNLGLPKAERMRKVAEIAYSGRISRILGSDAFKFDGKVYTVGFGLGESCPLLKKGDVSVGDVYGRIVLMDIAKHYGGKYFEVRDSEGVRDAFCKSLKALEAVPPSSKREWDIAEMPERGMVISRFITVKNKTGFYPALMQMHVINDDEAVFAKRVELACHGINTSFAGTIRQAYVSGDRVCYGKRCFPISCAFPIHPSLIKPGYRSLNITLEGGKVFIR